MTIDLTTSGWQHGFLTLVPLCSYHDARDNEQDSGRFRLPEKAPGLQAVNGWTSRTLQRPFSHQTGGICSFNYCGCTSCSNGPTQAPRSIHDNSFQLPLFGHLGKIRT